MNNPVIPTTQGQICKLLHPPSLEKAAEAYLILEDLTSYEDTAIIYVISLSDLQKNIENPTASPLQAFIKSDLSVVAEDLKSYLDSMMGPNDQERLIAGN